MAAGIYPSWFKFKGYIHIVGHLDFKNRAKEIIGKVTNDKYVARYAFYPLVHSIIKERRYKRVRYDSNSRSHTYKERPLHYANHFDALIFSYYAECLQTLYEKRLSGISGLDKSVIAYRKIASNDEGKCKSTIHFAHEFFEEIKSRSKVDGKCAVLTFDIKNFFSGLDHIVLKEAWKSLLGVERLPCDHYNVFKASTLFSYIYLRDLKNKCRTSFDESELARIRSSNGIHAFFDSPKSFRTKIRSGELPIYKFPFRDKKTKLPIGIPQGLPISAVLANLYLLSFDCKIHKYLVEQLGCYYRRYSDDIVLICNEENAEYVKRFVLDGIKESKVEISIAKTEHFVFKEVAIGKHPPRLTSIKCLNEKKHVGVPLTYLGFEFNGQKILLKSANLAKFYRRMIYSVKSRIKRAKNICQQIPDGKMAVYRRQLYRLYTTYPLRGTKTKVRVKTFKKNHFGTFTMCVAHNKRPLKSNYLTYVHRAAEIMDEPAIIYQIRKHKSIFNQAISRHIKK